MCGARNSNGVTAAATEKEESEREMLSLRRSSKQKLTFPKKQKLLCFACLLTSKENETWKRKKDYEKEKKERRERNTEIVVNKKIRSRLV